MSRFKIILFLILGVAIIAALIVWQFIVSFHTITLNISGNVTTDIYKVEGGKNQSVFKTVNSTTSISLQNGDYCAQPTDTQYDTTPICFTVQGKDMSIAINPDYSADYLGQLLLPQLAQIDSVITAKYSAVINNYTLKDGQLYGRGEWYGATLTQKVAPSDRGDIYRVLLEKKGDTWTIVAYPQISLNKYDYPNVPFNILSNVNKLLGVY